MDPTRFDRLSRALAAHGPRRGVLGLLAAAPVVGGLLGLLTPEETEAGGRRKRRKTRNKRRSGSDKKNRKGKHKKKKQPTCTPTTCAAEGKTCGRLPDGCGTTLDCGPCTCATGCHPDCQTCNPATGLCDDVANDTPCDDGDLCTQTDTCQNGTCVGGSPVVCTTPPGPCYQATGTCEPDGSCLYAFKPQGAACNDGDACTEPDACDGTGACIAGAPVTCPALNQCYEQGICNTSTGVCTTPRKADGAACDDGDACTINEVCTGGVCGGGSPKCSGGQMCQSDGTCCLPDTADLQTAITGAASGATIRLCAGTWEVSSTVVIGKTLTLSGAGDDETVLDGGNAVRVLQIASGAVVTVQDLTITKGKAVGGDFFERAGGGVFNQGTLRLVGIHITENTATNNSFGGGGILNYQGTLTLGAGSRVTGNTATSSGGGGINNFNGNLILQSGSRVTGNSAGYGGGIASQGTLTLQNGSRVSGNTAISVTAGGGIYNTSMTLEPGALVCDNSAPQCAGSYHAGCPNPSEGTCPS